MYIIYQLNLCSLFATRLKYIIMKSKIVNDYLSMLIDLNLVKEIDTQSDARSNTRNQTNTMKFIIIEMLLDVDYTY